MQDIESPWLICWVINTSFHFLITACYLSTRSLWFVRKFGLIIMSLWFHVNVCAQSFDVDAYEEEIGMEYGERIYTLLSKKWFETKSLKLLELFCRLLRLIGPMIFSRKTEQGKWRVGWVERWLLQDQGSKVHRFVCWYMWKSHS